MLDEILDPGNLGAILRSAYYLGADAVTLSSRNCAPLSPVCLKAAAGAAELLPILEQNRSDKMITASSENGWTFYAGVPPPTKNQERRDRYVWSSAVAGALRKGPVCLVLGSEGEGLRPFLKKFVKYCVSLDKGPGTEAIVDSLNVGGPCVCVVGGVLMLWVGQCCFCAAVFELLEGVGGGWDGVRYWGVTLSVNTKLEFLAAIAASVKTGSRYITRPQPSLR